MKDVIINLLIGTFGGLVATALVIGLKSIWQRIIGPWFEDKVYKDSLIEGRWYAVAPELPDDDREDVVELNRVGHAVSGTLTCTAGEDKGKTYEITGTFQNLILTVTYLSLDRKCLDRGSMSLMLIRNGEMFEGVSAFYNDKEHKVRSIYCHWYRTPSELKTVRQEKASMREWIVKEEEVAEAMMKPSLPHVKNQEAETQKSLQATRKTTCLKSNVILTQFT